MATPPAPSCASNVECVAFAVLLPVAVLSPESAVVGLAVLRFVDSGSSTAVVLSFLSVEVSLLLAAVLVGAAVTLAPTTFFC